MSDLKSKLPDLKELSCMASKLFKDVKTSVSEIIDDYKKKREQDAANAEVKSEKKEDVVTVSKTKKSKTVKEKNSENNKD